MAQHRLYNLIEYMAGTENRYLLMDEVGRKTRSMSRLNLIPLNGLPGWPTSAHSISKGSQAISRRGRSANNGAKPTGWYAYRKAHAQRFKR